jgi:hypothetical protein
MAAGVATYRRCAPRQRAGRCPLPVESRPFARQQAAKRPVPERSCPTLSTPDHPAAKSARSRERARFHRGHRADPQTHGNRAPPTKHSPRCAGALQVARGRPR